MLLPLLQTSIEPLRGQVTGGGLGIERAWNQLVYQVKGIFKLTVDKF